MQPFFTAQGLALTKLTMPIFHNTDLAL